jgi:hypothetical protein
MKIEISEAERQLLVDAVNNECKRLAHVIGARGPESDPFSNITNKGQDERRMKYEELFDKLVTAKGDDDATGNTARKSSPPASRKRPGTKKPAHDRGTRTDDRAAD